MQTESNTKRMRNEIRFSKICRTSTFWSLEFSRRNFAEDADVDDSDVRRWRVTPQISADFD
jgi:hypothetical protein